MPDPVPYVMMTVTLPGKPTLRAAGRRLGISAKHFDAAYGVVPLDPDNALYAVRIDADAAAIAGVPFNDAKIRPLR